VADGVEGLDGEAGLELEDELSGVLEAPVDGDVVVEEELLLDGGVDGGVLEDDELLDGVVGVVEAPLGAPSLPHAASANAAATAISSALFICISFEWTWGGLRPPQRQGGEPDILETLQ
jgi:hypothetical protein